MASPPQIGSGTPILTATCKIRVEIGVQWRFKVVVLRYGPLEFKQRGRPSRPSGVPISTGSGIAVPCDTSDIRAESTPCPCASAIWYIPQRRSDVALTYTTANVPGESIQRRASECSRTFLVVLKPPISDTRDSNCIFTMIFGGSGIIPTLT